MHVRWWFSGLKRLFCTLGSWLGSNKFNPKRSKSCFHRQLLDRSLCRPIDLSPRSELYAVSPKMDKALQQHLAEHDFIRDFWGEAGGRAQLLGIRGLRGRRHGSSRRDFGLLESWSRFDPGFPFKP